VLYVFPIAGSIGGDWRRADEGSAQEGLKSDALSKEGLVAVLPFSRKRESAVPAKSWRMHAFRGHDSAGACWRLAPETFEAQPDAMVGFFYLGSP
jgi:hypothetical protein